MSYNRVTRFQKWLLSRTEAHRRGGRCPVREVQLEKSFEQFSFRQCSAASTAAIEWQTFKPAASVLRATALQWLKVALHYMLLQFPSAS